MNYEKKHKYSFYEDLQTRYSFSANPYSEDFHELADIIINLEEKVALLSVANDNSTGDILSKIPILEVRQDSLQSQLDNLYGVALRLGLHDACDWLRSKGMHK